MKPEIILLLDKGFKPLEIAELLGVSFQLVYYYNRLYKPAKEKVDQIILEKFGVVKK